MHRVFSRLCRSLALAAAVAAGAWAAEPAPPQELAPAVALSHCAENLKAAFASNDSAALQAAVQDVELLRRTYGVMDVLPLVEAMAVHARGLGNQGRAQAGLRVLDTVERWAPGNPTLIGTRIILLRQQGPEGWLWGIADVVELTRLRLSHPQHRWLWGVQHMAWIRLLATLLLWGWALTLMLRYRRVFRNIWEAPLERKLVHPHLRALAGAVLVALPVLAGLDPGISAMLVLWLLAPFLMSTEIKATLLVLLLQLVHPVLGLLEPMAADRPAPSIVTLQTRPQPTPGMDQAIARLPEADRTFLAGWRHLQFQRWAEAESTFQGLVPSHPDRQEVMNNLGVAKFQRGDLAGAQTCFDTAATFGPPRAEVLLNQAVLAFRQMDGPLGFAKQEDARRLAPETFSRTLAVNQARTEQRTFPLPLADTPARVAALAGPGQPQGQGRRALDLILLAGLVVPLAGAIAFFLRLKASINQAHPSQCTRCGDPFHTTDSPDVYVCSKCHHLFVLKDGLHGESRKKKVEEVADHQAAQRWIHRSLMVLLPGMDHCFLGETREGLLEFGVLGLAVGVALATGRTVRYPGEILADPSSIWLPIALALLIVLFLRSWLKLLPRRG